VDGAVRPQGIKKKKLAGASRPAENSQTPQLLNLSPQASSALQFFGNTLGKKHNFARPEKDLPATS
jgi:hypothetical protein